MSNFQALPRVMRTSASVTLKAFLILTLFPVERLSAASAPPSSNPETELFNNLDFGIPELSKVSEAWKAKNIDGAEKALAQYLRVRSSVQWGGATDGNRPNVRPAARATAESAVQGSVASVDSLAYSFPNGKIDWRFNAPLKTGHPRNDEWQWQLNRMSFWEDLANSYKATGDERYAQAFVSQLRSWIAQCPEPTQVDNNVGSPWRTIDAGVRVNYVWPDAFFAFRHSSAMTNKDLIAFTTAFYEHGNYLRKYHSTLNWVSMEMSGLYAVGSLFPEFQQSNDWRSYAVKTLADYESVLFLPDGGESELSTGYHNITIGNLLRIRQIASWNNRVSDLSTGYSAPIERAFNWDLDLITPDFNIPKINDAWSVDLPNSFKTAVAMFPARSDFKWVASKGQSGAPPEKPSVFLNWSGFAAMRSGFTSDANYLLFRLGPMGAGHMHQDKLDVLLWAYGRELLFDSGGGSYEKSKFRSWATSTFSHNCIIVDNLGQTEPPQNEPNPEKDPTRVSQSPINAHWESNSKYDFALGQYSGGFGPNAVKLGVQDREVLFLKPDVYVVADRMTPGDTASHRYEARWNLLTTHSQLDSGNHSFVTSDSGKPNAVIVPLLARGVDVKYASGQEQPEILGWQLNHDGDPKRVPATTLLYARSGAGKQRFLTIILPLRRGESNPVASVKQADDGNSAAIIFKDGRRFVVAAPGERGISVDEFLADGKKGRSVQAGSN